MYQYEYLRPTSLAEAFTLKNGAVSDTLFVAGGTDVFLLIKKNIISPSRLISLRAVDELKGIRREGSQIVIGSGTTIGEIEKSPLVRKHLPALYDAVIDMASRQIRNVATIGGNIVNASPGADTAAPLLIYDALVTIVDHHLAERTVPLVDFFKGPKKVHLGAAEMVKNFTLRIPVLGSGSAYSKFMKRKAMDLANVGVAMKITFSEDRICHDVRIGLATVAPTPMRACKTEAFLQDRVLDEAVLREAGEIAALEIAPIDDLRGQAWHKIEVVKTYIRRTAMLAAKRASCAT